MSNVILHDLLLVIDSWQTIELRDEYGVLYLGQRDKLLFEPEIKKYLTHRTQKCYIKTNRPNSVFKSWLCVFID